MSDEFPTEGVLSSARELDQMSVSDVLSLIHAEDGRAHASVGAVLPDIARAVDVLACSIRGGGRWFNVGAGTSGRLGVLDASEVPPTFGMPATCVQGVIAGGDAALTRAVEGAEDNAEAGAWALRERGLQVGDAVLSISASGRTPFALGAFEAAHEVGARRIALCCDPRSPLAEAAEITIAPQVGPEVVAGSTRMKGGLVQKMVLHMLSTAVMVRLGRVTGNLMANMIPASNKLRERNLRIVMALTEVDADAAAHYLEEASGNAAEAVALARRAGAAG
jgi:N-acetylmuramic acid 6-phosphate etherase